MKENSEPGGTFSTAIPESFKAKESTLNNYREHQYLLNEENICKVDILTSPLFARPLFSPDFIILFENLDGDIDKPFRI